MLFASACSIPPAMAFSQRKHQEQWKLAQNQTPSIIRLLKKRRISWKLEKLLLKSLLSSKRKKVLKISWEPFTYVFSPDWGSNVEWKYGLGMYISIRYVCIRRHVWKAFCDASFTKPLEDYWTVDEYSNAWAHSTLKVSYYIQKSPKRYISYSFYSVNIFLSYDRFQKLSFRNGIVAKRKNNQILCLIKGKTKDNDIRKKVSNGFISLRISIEQFKTILDSYSTSEDTLHKRLLLAFKPGGLTRGLVIPSRRGIFFTTSHLLVEFVYFYLWSREDIISTSLGRMSLLTKFCYPTNSLFCYFFLQEHLWMSSRKL